MSKPIRATRDTLLPGTIWQSAAGLSVFKVYSRGERTVMVAVPSASPHTVTISDFLKLDVFYKIQPIKEPTT